MNNYVKSFLHRGLIFGGGGPLIMAIIFVVLEKTADNFSLSGTQACLAIFSTYLLAFVHAGASVFNQIEHWSLPKSLLCHFGTLYAAYISCYLLNTWIPFKAEVILVFTAIFVATYFAVWIIVYFAVKVTSKQFNAKLN